MMLAHKEARLDVILVLDFHKEELDHRSHSRPTYYSKATRSHSRHRSKRYYDKCEQILIIEDTRHGRPSQRVYGARVEERSGSQESRSLLVEEL
jgi:hypothetical protein